MKAKTFSKPGPALQPIATNERSYAVPRPGPVPAGIGFRSELLDFDRGIRVGNLQPHERITRILKSALEAGFASTPIQRHRAH